MITLVTPTIQGMPVPPKPEPSPPLGTSSRTFGSMPKSSRSDTLFEEPPADHRWGDSAMYAGLFGGVGMGMYGVGSAAVGAKRSVANTMGTMQNSINSTAQRVTRTVDAGVRQGLPVLLESAEKVKSSAKILSFVITIMFGIMVLFLLLEIYKINTNRKRYYY
ncbi:hypothetical protein EhVM1_000005 [Emiliania huxleyi virus M1]|nr:hypothetical protein EhVM1_000005 [Emiliania huxleyi virus M1]